MYSEKNKDALKVFVIIVFLFLSHNIHACDCVTNNNYFESADVVFVGKVISIKEFIHVPYTSVEALHENYYIVTLEVLEMSKGSFAQYKKKTIEVRIHSLGESACGIEFHNYKLFRVFCIKSSYTGYLITSVCAGVNYLSDTEEPTKIMRFHY